MNGSFTATTARATGHEGMKNGRLLLQELGHHLVLLRLQLSKLSSMPRASQNTLDGCKNLHKQTAD